MLWLCYRGEAISPSSINAFKNGLNKIRKTRAALQIQDQSPESRQMRNQSHTQLTRLVATGLGFATRPRMGFFMD